MRRQRDVLANIKLLSIYMNGLKEDVKIALDDSLKYLENSKQMASSISIPSDFTCSTKMKNIDDRVEDVIAKVDDIKLWLQHTIHKFEETIRINKCIVDILATGNLNEYLEANKLLFNDYELDLIKQEVLLGTCEEVMDELLKHGVHYSVDEANDLTEHDIEEGCNFSEHECCCATYIAAVLYISGALEEEFINKYDYNYTGSGGIGDMLEDAGWEKITDKDAVKPGDVCVYPPSNGKAGHVFMYSGGEDGNEIWDQKSGCISKDRKGNPIEPLRGPRYDWETTFKNKSNLTIWRMPSYKDVV